MELGAQLLRRGPSDITKEALLGANVNFSHVHNLPPLPAHRSRHNGTADSGTDAFNDRPSRRHSYFDNRRDQHGGFDEGLGRNADMVSASEDHLNLEAHEINA